MDLQFDDKVRGLQDRLTRFMDEYIYPLEVDFSRHVRRQEDGPRHRFSMS